MSRAVLSCRQLLSAGLVLTAVTACSKGGPDVLTPIDRTPPATPAPAPAPTPTPAPVPAPTPLAAPTLGFTAPQNSIDLANYTLVAQYDLPVGSGANLLAAEASAITYNPDTDSLFLVGDNGTAVTQVSKTGQLIDTMTLPADSSKPQGTYLYDLEGIAYVGGGQFVVAEERFRQVDRFSYTPGTTLAPAAIQQVKLGTTIGNIGFEGISADPITGGFVIAKEKTPLGLFTTTVDFAAGTASNGSPTTENSTNLFDPALAGTADFGDLYALANVLPAVAADRADLLVLSQESGVLLKMDRSGRIKSRIDVGLSAQHEGVTLDRANNLYLANELGGGAGKPQLWVYVPTTAATAVGIGSNLYLSFAVPVAAGTGNIVISNGSGDTRTIAIGDTNQITVSGNTVTVNPTADLAPGSSYTVQAAAGTVRAASGGSTSGAVSLPFTTRLEAVPPTLTGSMPADNALAVTGSRVVLSFSEPVRAGSGNIVITGANGDLRTIAVGDRTQATFSGSTLDITPSADFAPSTSYNVQLARGVVQDIAGNAYAGLIGPEALNFTTASAGGSPPPTTLAAGDVLFMAMNADQTDAIAFTLLKAVTAGTQIIFSDRDYSASAGFPTSGEAAYSWTADVAYAAGTIVTIQTAGPTSDLGVSTGEGGGIGGNGETYYAVQGTLNGGAITPQRFLAAMNLGPAAGDIPTELTSAGAFIRFDEDNARYAGSLDRSNPTTFANRVKDATTWERREDPGYPLTSGSFFNTTPPPSPGAQTTLNAGDVLFLAANGDATDAFGFAILKDIVAGTQIVFTDNEFTAAATPQFNSGEAVITWTADKAYLAGTLVTIQPDATPVVASRGTVSGTGGGISTTAETYHAVQGTVDGSGVITVDRALAAVTLSGASDSEIPAAVTGTGAALSFTLDNLRYTGSYDRSTLATFTTRIKDVANYTTSDTVAFPVLGNSLFGGTPLVAGDVLFMAANADAPDAFAFTILKAVVAGTEIVFTDKNYTAAGGFPTNEAAFTWTADVAYPAGTIVTIATDPLSADKGTVYGAGGGISPSAETYYALQGTVLNPAAGQVVPDRFLAAINIRAAAGEIPAEISGAGAYIRFDADNMRYAGSLDRSDLAAFAARVKDPAQWQTNDAAPYPTTGGSLFP